MAFLAAPLAMKVGKSSLNFACNQGLKQISSFVKDIVHQNADKVCSPEFPSTMVTQIFGLMKSSSVFPRQLREILEKNREPLDGFAQNLVSDPMFKQACSSKNYEAIDTLIDDKIKALKEQILVCPKEGGRGKKTRRRRISRKRKSKRVFAKF